MFETKVVQKIKTHILYSVTFFFFLSFENRAFYDITWKNIVERSRPQVTIQRMRTACWIPSAINTHSQYVIPTAFPLQHWLHERVSMLHNTHIACLGQLIHEP